MVTPGQTNMVNEVPDSMLRLCRLIVKAFYGPEYSVVIDLLIRNVSMREDELRELVKFEPKQLRTILLAMKQDKIVKERQEIEHRAEGRSLRHNYYFISYASMINMVKYKLDQMRKRLESEENSISSRPSFKCTKCSKVYTDLEISFLWNGTDMKCVYCFSQVIENEIVNEVDTTKTSLAKFNEQLWPVLEMLISLDGVQLAQHLLEPDPPSKLRKVNRDRKSDGIDGMVKRYGDGDAHDGRTRNLQSVVISKENSGAQGAPKEIPIWMQASTVVADSADDQRPIDQSEPSTSHPDFVMQLLAHEAKGAGEEKETDDGDEEGDFEEVPEEIVVSVQGEKKSLEELMSNPDLVNLMTEAEKERYVEVTQQAFQHFYME